MRTVCLEFFGDVNGVAQEEGWLAELLAGRDRTLAGPTAAPDGLLFVGPRYPAACQLPVEVTL